jgi:YD repeat-containing protein
MTFFRNFLLIALPVFLFSEFDPESQFLDFKTFEMQSAITNISSEPSTIAAGCVNVITGDYVESDVDLTIPAPETFQIQRCYTSSGRDSSLLQKSWQINHQGCFNLKSHVTNKHKHLKAAIKIANGERLLLEGEERRNVNTFTMKAPKEHFDKGITNIGKGVISAQNHIKNVRLVLENHERIFAELIYGSGEIFQFKRVRDTADYLLIMNRRPTGLRFHYDYDHAHSLKLIEQQNIYNEKVAVCSVHVNLVSPHDEEERWMTFIAPDGRRVDYLSRCYDKIKGFKILKAVRRSDGPDVDYDIEEAKYSTSGNTTHGYFARIRRKMLPNHRFQALEYYHKGFNQVLNKKVYIEDGWNPKFNRVKKILEPAGCDETPLETHAFIYHLPEDKDEIKTTKVVDGLGRKTIYSFNQKDRLISVVKCNKHRQPFTEENLHWGTKDTSREMNLKGRSFGYYGKSEKIYARRYTYDEHGNMISESIYGDISGRATAPLLLDAKGKPISNGVEKNRRIMGYNNDPYHRLATMKEGDITTSYQYLGNTCHQTECLYSDPSGIFTRHFYDIDQNGLVICHIRDDGTNSSKESLEGVTERTIDRILRSYTYPCGLPLEETKSCLNLQTGQEELICKKIQKFDLQGRMISQETYGSDGQLAFVKEWAYNSWGNLLMEKNALGDVIRRTFDGNGNCIREEGPMSDSFKSFTYDYMNRLIDASENHSDGTVISQKFHYDLMGNKVAMVDGFGNITNYTYDAFNRCIREEGPGTPSPEGVIQSFVQHYAYDPLGNRTQEIDSLGHSTSTTYTILGKPTCIEYADGSKEQFYYDLHGRLIEAITKTGATTKYTRDFQGRVTKTEVYSPDGELFSNSEAGYNSFHLLWEKDPAGILTQYEYDPAGRLKRIIKDESLTEYEYDPLSRICKTTITNHDRTEGTITYQMQDPEGKVLEERTEDLAGTIYLYKRNTYDALGRKTSVQEGDAISRFTFDSHGNVTTSIDPEGNKTTRFNDYFHFNRYGQHVLKTISTDPKGIQTVTEFNTQGKPYLIQILNPLGETLREEEHYYDACGQKIQVNMISCKSQGRSSEMCYRFAYDSMKRQISFIQAYGTSDAKLTSTSYDLMGMKTGTTRSDGVEIRFKHDYLGRLTERESSDGSIHDVYIYDVKSNPLEVRNLINNTATLRTFDGLGQTTSETLQNGLKTCISYNYDGSIAQVILPDESSVRYQYAAGFLKRAERYKSSGSLHYVHEITAYDQNGRILKENLPYNCGCSERTYTPNGKLKSYETRKFSETDIQYDSCNNVLSRTIKDLKGSYQESYSYDDLGQLTTEQGFAAHNYSYDGLYNRLSKDENTYTLNSQNQLLSDGLENYTYDLNGNLIDKDGVRITYDALDRPIQIQKDGATATYTYDELNRCIERKCQKDNLRFFYITQAEVGACNSKSTIVQFQMAGPGRAGAP